MQRRKELPRPVLISIILLFLAVTLLSLSSASSPASGASTKFAVIGDFGEAGPNEQAVADLVHSWNVDFVATVGDNNYPDGEMTTMDANVGQYYQQYIKPYLGAYGSGSPDINRFFPAIGNHDWNDINCDLTGTTCTGGHFDYFDLPGNERYFDIPWAPVHLFFVNSNPQEPDGITSNSKQAAWLQAQLAASTATWNLVIMHHAPYSSADRHGSTAEMQWPFKEWGASVVLAGHDHTYERLLVDDFPYFVDGLGGNSRRTFTDPPLPGSQVRYRDDYGALLVEADEAQITFQFFNTGGTLIDTFSLNSETPPDATATPTATATSTQDCYNLTLVHAGPGGQPQATPDSSAGCSPGTYAMGTLIQLKANPDNNAHVSKWSGSDNDNSSATTNTITMPSSNHMVVVFYEYGSVIESYLYLPVVLNPQSPTAERILNDPSSR